MRKWAEWLFQFTLPCRERLYRALNLEIKGVFQFTLPCRERRRHPTLPASEAEFQFTLPCRERLVVPEFFYGRGRVSIHAPV